MSRDNYIYSDLAWYRARSCEGGNCIEIAPANGMIIFRDSKDPNGSHLQFTKDEWAAFLGAAKGGDFDGLM